MNTTKLKNAGNLALFISWVIGLAILVIGSTGHVGWCFLVLVIGVVLSIILNGKYESVVLKGIESLQKEVESFTNKLSSSGKSLEKAQSEASSLTSKLADKDTEIAELKAKVAEYEAAAKADVAVEASTESGKKKSSKKK